MKNKSKEFELLLLYDILAAADCLCSASTAFLLFLQLDEILKFNDLLTGYCRSR